MVIATAIIGVITGLVMYIVTPMLANTVQSIANLIPRVEVKLSEKVANIYRGLAITSIGDHLYVKMSNGGYTPVSVKHAGSFLVGKLNGDLQWWIDPRGKTGRLYGQVVGIAHEDNNLIFSPAEMRVAEKVKEKKREREFEQSQLATDGGQTPLYEYTAVSQQKYIDMDLAPDAARGNCDPRAGLRVEEYVRKMYQDFDSTPVIEYMAWIVSFGAGVGAVYMLAKLAETVDGMGSPVENVPLIVAGVLI